MIILDTHVWLWWNLESPRFREAHRRAISENQDDGIGICSFSCWEISKLFERGKLELSVDLAEWFETSLRQPGVVLLDMTPEIAIESNRLPGDFHRDPADRILVATALEHSCPLVTSDGRILEYPHVNTIG